MRNLLLLLILASLASCYTARPHMGGEGMASGVYTPPPTDTLTQSLFHDRSATISEEGIARILNGNYRMPASLRVAVVRLRPARSAWYMENDETYLKTQQSYLDAVVATLRSSPRVGNVMLVPELLLPRTPSFVQIREAAVRMQADAVLVYAVSGDIYSKYKFFSRPDIKAFATTQAMLLDVRTGLVPFSTAVTRDQLSQRTKEDTDNEEARQRVQHEAVLLTLTELGTQLTQALQKN